ncbi:MAG: CPBP family intramembrane glutamic endopeptidase [Chloroflexota bacterium]
MKRLSENYPVQIACALVVSLFLLRAIDVFIVRSDEWFGEQVLTKVAGVILIFAYVWFARGNLAGIGLHSRNWLIFILLGLCITMVGLFIGYGVEWLYLSNKGLSPRLLVEPQGNTLIPEYVTTGGIFFAFTLLGGNIINSFFEEGLFRGILITHLGSRMSLAKANAIQSSLFGIWHIAWPLRDFVDGRTTLMAALWTSIGYVLLSGLIGFAWGYLYLETNSLWTSWSAHTLNNSVINLVHITTSMGIASTLGLRVAVSTISIVALLLIIRKVAQTRAINHPVCRDRRKSG